MIYSVTNKKDSKFQILTFCLLLNQILNSNLEILEKINVNAFKFYDFALNSSLKIINLLVFGLLNLL